MKKQSIVISAPVDTYSGYGARARDFIKAIVELDNYDVTVLSQVWGYNRMGYLNDSNDTVIQPLIVDRINFTPDIWVQVTVPNEFQRVGRYNIGLTAGIESTLIPKDWIDGCNRMDLVLTSSVHSKEVITTTVFTEKDNTTGQIIKEHKVSTPVQVLFEGVDTNTYFKTDSKGHTKLNLDLDSIKEQFCFLLVGHWLEGDYGHDRKNIPFTVKMFYEAFKDKKNAPALILKTQGANTSYVNRRELLEKIEAVRKSMIASTLPNVYLLHGDVSDEEMNELYNHPKVKAMVSFAKGEGFGRPLLEFSVVGKPIIASGWSGQMDFLDKVNNLLVGGELQNVHESVNNPFLIKESRWLSPNETQCKKSFKEVYTNYKKYVEPSRKVAKRNRDTFSYERMRDTIGNILTQHIPRNVQLNLDINNG